MIVPVQKSGIFDYSLPNYSASKFLTSWKFNFFHLPGGFFFFFFDKLTILKFLLIKVKQLEINQKKMIIIIKFSSN